MRSFFLLICLAGVLAHSIALAGELSGPADVVDGDTIVIGGTVIDLYGIDAPELDHNGKEQICEQDGQAYRCGLIAAGRLAETLAGETVTCEPERTDDTGRILAKCYINRGENVSGWMVTKGWAVVDTRYSDEYSDWQAWAKAGGAGVWAGPFELPWLWRESQ
jgi:endonuclease YncB( thermonuclease family)